MKYRAAKTPYPYSERHDWSPRQIRTDAADTFRLATLLEFYDERTAAANTSAWLGTFTSGGAGGGARGRVRRDWSVPLPRPHLEVLMVLPLELKLDVVVLLTVRAGLWNSIPQQVTILRASSSPERRVKSGPKKGASLT